MAHELWGWGQAVASEAEQAAPALQPGDVVDWPSLVRYRRQFDGVAVQKRPEWLPEHVALLGGRLREEGQAGRGRGALGRMAKELGYSREVRLRQILEGGAYDLRTGEKKKAAATPFDGMGTVLTGTS